MLLPATAAWAGQEAVEQPAAETPASDGENKPTDPRLDPFAALEAAHPTPEGTKKAIERLRKLGAIVSWVLWETNRRELSIVFRNRGEVELRDDLPSRWQGTDADLGLLNDVVLVDPVGVMIDFNYVTPRALSELKLDRPLDSLRLYNLTDAVAAKLTHLPLCRKLIVVSWKLSPVGTRHLAALAGEIPSLSLQGRDDQKNPQRGPGEGDLAELAVLDDLDSLEIVSSHVTPLGLKPLAGLKKLKHLKLRDCPLLGGSDLAGLAGAQSLESLELAIATGGAALAAVARLSALEELKIEFYDLALRDVRPLANLARLRRLELLWAMTPSGGNFPQPQHREQLGIAFGEVVGSLPGLQVFINNNDTAFMNSKALAALARSKSLEDSAVSYTLIDDECLAHVGRLTTLQHLDLRDDRYERTVTAQGLANLARLTRLEELHLRHSQVDAAGLTALGPLAKLKSLDLRASTCDDACCRVLPEVLPRLTSLDLEGTEITDAGIELLIRLADLRTLDITKARRVTDASIPSLARFKNLRRLNVGGAGLSGEGWQTLNRTLPGVDIGATVD